jgi:hypothetical protein
MLAALTLGQQFVGADSESLGVSPPEVGLEQRRRSGPRVRGALEGLVGGHRTRSG